MLQPDLFLGTSGGIASPQSPSSHGIFSPPPASSPRTLSTQGSPCAASCRGCSSPSPPPPPSKVSENVHNERTTRRWYLTVIVLLYIGLITSFCLNVTLLVRREPERVVRLEEMARTGPGEHYLLSQDLSVEWSRTIIGLFLVGCFV